jgi:hypothetical protein
VYRFHVAASEKPRTSIYLAPLLECHKASEHQPSEVWLSPTGLINLVSQLMEDLLLCSSYLPLRVPNGVLSTCHQAFFLAPLPGIEEEEATTSTRHQHFFWHRCRGERRFLQGESLTSNLLLCYCFALFYFFLHRFIKNTKKLVSFIVVTFTCLFLVLLEWVLLRTPSCVILLAPKTMILSALLLRHLLLRQIFMKLNLLC